MWRRSKSDEDGADSDEMALAEAEVVAAEAAACARRCTSGPERVASLVTERGAKASRGAGATDPR